MKNRADMSLEEERVFVETMFNECESMGFRDVFFTPWSDYRSRIGQKFSVLGRISEAGGESLECLPLWRIRFEDGVETTAYPEEIIAGVETTEGVCNG